MALVKSSHFKWIDGVLHQLFEPHANTPEATAEWKPVAGDPPAASSSLSALEARVAALEAASNAKAPASTAKT